MENIIRKLVIALCLVGAAQILSPVGQSIGVSIAMADDDNDGGSDHDSDHRSDDDRSNGSRSNNNTSSNGDTSSHTSSSNALNAVRRDGVLPYAAIKRKLPRNYGTRIVGVELKKDNGLWVYEFKIVSPEGRLIELYLDGRSGDVIKVDND